MKLTITKALQKGIIAHQSGDIQEADRCYTAILKAKPKHPDANHNMGVLAVGLGKLKESLIFFQTALEADLEIKQYWLSYIDALVRLNRFEEANNIIKKAKLNGIKGDYFDNIEAKVISSIKKENINISTSQDPPQKLQQSLVDHYNNGNLNKCLIDSNYLINEFPYSVFLYNFIGVINRSLKKYEEALRNYNKVLKINPYHEEAYNNMGNIFMDKGQLENAIEAFKQAIKINLNYDTAYSNISIALKGKIFKGPDTFLQNIMIKLLERNNYVSPSDIVESGISLLKFEPYMKFVFKNSSQIKSFQSLENIIGDLSKVPLLLKLMSICPLPNLQLEDALTKLRFELLSSISKNEGKKEILLFQSALALQCFTNEYIFNLTDLEKKELKLLEFEVEKKLSEGLQPSPTKILCLASYKALYKYQWSNLLVINKDIEELYLRQISEPNQERSIIDKILVHKEITDKVSSKVKQQYEENPYPRWVNIKSNSKSETISIIVKELNLNLSYNDIKHLTKPKILVAGCGTGQHSISLATRFKNSEILAIDLSMSSLAYAQRKTNELGIKNINYMQADILDLDKYNKKFDIIDSSGVLHHMKDPVKGWKILTGLLRAKGLMRIGLYSELARESIIKIKKEINPKSISFSEDEIKLIRRDIIRFKNKKYEKIFVTKDFYSLSTLRDLLFHVQEHNFTIPQIKMCLENLNLVFCGFEISNKILSKFNLSKMSLNNLYNLENWDLFEKENQETFEGMYQFWCKKI